MYSVATVCPSCRCLPKSTGLVGLHITYPSPTPNLPRFLPEPNIHRHETKQFTSLRICSKYIMTLGRSPQFSTLHILLLRRTCLFMFLLSKQLLLVFVWTQRSLRDVPLDGWAVRDGRPNLSLFLDARRRWVPSPHESVSPSSCDMQQTFERWRFHLP